MTWAKPDYEPTAKEIQEFINSFGECEPGTHGSIEIIPTMERYIWSIPIFWGHRLVNEKTGMVSYSWLVPPLCDNCGNL